MDRNQEVLASINNAKNELNQLIEKQRKINHNIENTLNMSNQNKVQVVCKDYLDRLKTIDAKQLDLSRLLEIKRVDVESNADIVKTLDKAEDTLIKLDELCRNKRERNLEKSIITDIMVCYWNAVGIKLQFDAENSSTTLLLTNHDEENRELKECKIEMNISKENFEVIDVEPKSRLEEMKKIESDVKANGQGLTILVFKLYANFIGE